MTSTHASTSALREALLERQRKSLVKQREYFADAEQRKKQIDYEVAQAVTQMQIDTLALQTQIEQLNAQEYRASVNPNTNQPQSEVGHANLIDLWQDSHPLIADANARDNAPSIDAINVAAGSQDTGPQIARDTTCNDTAHHTTQTHHVLPTPTPETPSRTSLTTSSSPVTPAQTPLQDQVGVASVLQTLVDVTTSMTLPKPELLYFDGNPRSYHTFLCNFENHIGKKPLEPSVKLVYLIQYCTGRAKSLIKDCVLLPPSVGYTYALSLLRDQFGKRQQIARSYIDSFKRGDAFDENNVQALVDLYQSMRRCELALTHLGYSSDLNSIETMKRIVNRLPYRFQEMWADKASDIIESTKAEVKFSHLCEFVHERMQVSLYAYHCGFLPDAHAMSYDDGPHPHATCKVCSRNHDITQCQEFEDMTVQNRCDFVKRNRLCLNCLHHGHRAQECTKNSMCRQCNSKHHALVHINGFRRQ